jgi:hypothetical protein
MTPDQPTQPFDALRRRVISHQHPATRDERTQEFRGRIDETQ